MGYLRGSERMAIAAAEAKKMNQNLSPRLFFAVRLNMGQ